jgi:DNA-directed RNA polymerase sigma subunit (sigma70/sigma32)
MNVKLDNYSNTAPKWDWLVSGDISQIPILTNAATVLLTTFMTNGKKETVVNQEHGFEPMTLQEISDVEGVSKQRIAQILQSAQDKFKKAMNDKGIKIEDLL